ncbi:MAG: diguanylate cyclase [Deltaproteobacteria bacterium]|nr:diguanylate cyclase [Deltaproteobacteria bacterium]
MKSWHDKPVVLVADDDESIRVLLRAALGKEFEVVVCASGDEAWARILDEDAIPVQGIVADFMMPGLTGLEVLKQAGEFIPQVARILITASERVSDFTAAVNEARVHRFISKPLRVKDLPQLVWGALREVELETENHRLISELKDSNEQLTNALIQVRDHEQLLEEEVAERTLELKQAIADLEQLALHDGLTGLYNHRHFQDLLSVEVSRARRHEEPLSLLFLDVDYFKNYNDTHGHPAGDELLRGLARLLVKAKEGCLPSRASDVVARYGGEEFVVILPNTSSSGALIRAERLRALIEKATFRGEGEQPDGALTVSIGTSTFPDNSSDEASLISRADEALYQAKREGRNRVISADEVALAKKLQANM